MISSLISSCVALTLLTSVANGQSGNFSTQMALSQISRGQGVFTGTLGSSEYYQCGFTQKAFRAWVTQYPNSSNTPAIMSYLQRSISSMVTPLSNATVQAGLTPQSGISMDRLSNGNNLILRYQETGNQSYKTTAEALRLSIDINKRTPEGGLWYYVYPNWSYLDGMYSLLPFYTLYTNTFDAANATARSDTALQLDLLLRHCKDNATGLYVHGYDSSRTAVWANNTQGASPWVWGRAMGWLYMGLVDYLEELPKTASTYNTTLSTLQDASNRLASQADPTTGGWYQIIGQSNRTGNYIESSASSMFAYGMLKAVRLGYLSNMTISGTNYQAVATKAYDYLAKTFVVNQGNGTVGWNGTVAVCSLNSTASYDYYTGRPIEYNNVLGSNAFILASLERERL